jgi:Zn-dependent alcohol dehydrogenase
MGSATNFPSAVITRRYPLGQINEAFAEMNRGEVARSIVAF